MATTPYTVNTAQNRQQNTFFETDTDRWAGE